MAKIADKALQYIRDASFPDRIREPGYCNIMVLGVGGAGNNTVGRLSESKNIPAEFVAVNTDIQHLSAIDAGRRVLIGEKLTRGLGSGGDPEIGRAAIEESAEQVGKLLEGVDIAFVTAGMGGGTGTGAAPVIARLAKEKGAIVIGVVTMPFKIEKGRIQNALKGLNEIRKECDTVIVVDNNKLVMLVPQLPIGDAFRVGDGVLANMIEGITETISSPSLVNLDFADFRTIIKKGGIAVAGVGISDASNRVDDAVEKALNTPLLDVDYSKAKGALIHVEGDEEMTIEETNRVGEIVTQMMGDDALVIWGARVNPELAGSIKVTLIMTGVHSKYTLDAHDSIGVNIYQLDPSEDEGEPLEVNLGLYRI